MDAKLNIPDLPQRSYINVLDETIQYPGSPRLSKRHRVNNNLPGNSGFCPLIRRTKKLEAYIEQNLSQQAIESVKHTHSSIVARAAAFLLLEDSKASYIIEGERPSYTRADRWGKIIGKAGYTEISKEKLEQLQKEVIGNTRFVRLGFRKEGGFIGSHDRYSTTPIPVHISAKPGDLDTLITSLIEVNSLLKESNFPAVLAAAAIAFAFVFIHPFEDGNGRLHRYLLHHVLADNGFIPKGLVFPISSVILRRISEYLTTLENYSQKCLPMIKWRPTKQNNIEVLNDTIDFYRFFDATPQAEFLYDCVYETITETLPNEIDYLQKYDSMKTFIDEHFDMPEHTASLLINFLYQNDGKLSARTQKKEFIALTPSEIKILEQQFKTIFP